MRRRVARIQRDEGGRPPVAAYGIAHELRTPLTSLVVGTRILGVDEINPGDRQNIARDVAVETQRLANAVEDLLVVTGLDSPHAADEPVSLQATVRAELDRACRLAPELTVRMLLADDVPTVMTDERSVQHLVRNLIASAVTAAGERGKLEAVVATSPTGAARIRVAGRARRRDRLTPIRRVGTPLRDGAASVLAERLGGSLARSSERGVERASLTFPPPSPGERAAGDERADDGTDMQV
jgi:nitrogen-specific signal transduction histidine kinase